MNIVSILLLLFSISSCGQVKIASSQKQEVLDGKLLIGKWYSESDAEYVLVFEMKKYIELYGKDTTENMNYKVSTSCNLKDSSSIINLQKAYLLFYSNDGTVQQCNEIINFKRNILVIRPIYSGSFLAFKRRFLP